MCRPLLTSLILGPEGLAQGRAHVTEEDGLLAGFATWIETAGTMEPEDLFVDPGYMSAGLPRHSVRVMTARFRRSGL